MLHVLLLAAMLASPPPLHPQPAMTRVADGVLLFRTPDYEEVYVDGNVVALLTPAGTVIYDGSALPATAAQILSQVRAESKAPVRYLVNSHWHWDHVTGNSVWRDAFPDVRIISHVKTREDLLIRGANHLRYWNDEMLPNLLSTLKERRAKAEGAEQERLTRAVGDAEYFLADHRKARIELPDVTFTDELTLHLGGRELRLLHLGRGNSPGDAMLYLPAEKILLTGDVLVHPVPYAFGAFPSEWLQVLKKIDAMDVAVIVPGHGEVQRDKAYLRQVIALFEDVRAKFLALKKKGVPLEEARKQVDLAEWRQRFTKGERAAVEMFDESIVKGYSKSVYAEDDAPLPDRPPEAKR